MKPRVVYRTNIPAPYMVERFDRIAERGNLDFAAWFDEERQLFRSRDGLAPTEEPSWTLG